jgi:hypothetical protein
MATGSPSSGGDGGGGDVNDRIADMRGARLVKANFYRLGNQIVFVTAIMNSKSGRTVGPARVRLVDNFQRPGGRWAGDEEVMSTALIPIRTIEERRDMLLSQGNTSDYKPERAIGDRGKYERLYGPDTAGVVRPPGSGIGAALASAGLEQALGRVKDSVTVGATQTNATLGTMNAAQQLGFANLQAATTAGLTNIQASQLTAGDVQDRVASAMRGHQVAAADAPKVRGIYARFPRLREAVNDKILTNTVLLRMSEDELERAERDLAGGKENNEQRLADAFSRSREEAQGRVGVNQTILYNQRDSAHQGAPFVSSIPRKIRLYQRPTFSR